MRKIPTNSPPTRHKAELPLDLDGPQEGEVLAVGPGRFEDGQRLPLDIQVGDKVIYSKYGGTEVTVDGEDVLILSENDILARIGVTPKAPAKRTASRKPAAKKTAAKKK